MVENLNDVMRRVVGPGNVVINRHHQTIKMGRWRGTRGMAND